MKAQSVARYGDAHPWGVALALSTLVWPFGWFVTRSLTVSLVLSGATLLLIGLDRQEWTDDHPWLCAVLVGLVTGTAIYLFARADDYPRAAVAGVGTGVAWLFFERYRRCSGRRGRL